MEKLVLIVHVLTAISIIGLILIQQGRGAEAGASFGAGASQTVFGSSGAGNFFTRTTTILAFVFFCTSFGLAVIAKQQAAVGSESDIPAVVESIDEAPVVEDSGTVSDVPQVNDVDSSDVNDVPVVEDDK